MIFNKPSHLLYIAGFSIAQASYSFPYYEANISGDLNYARIQGIAQTPKGGMPNTTDSLRPKLREAGINDEWYYDIGAGMQFYHFFLNFKYHHLQPQGSDQLKQGLLTHNQFIPQGQNINLRVDYDWYQLQMGNYFRLFKHYEISPIVEGHWIHYRYSFSSLPFASARSFSMAASNLGLGFRFPFGETIQGEIQATTTLPFSNLSVNRVNLTLHKNIPLCPHITLRPQLELGIFRIDYEDFQLIANHMQYTAAPNIALGFTLAFY